MRDDDTEGYIVCQNRKEREGRRQEMEQCGTGCEVGDMINGTLNDIGQEEAREERRRRK